MTGLIVRCRQCGREWSADRKDYLQETWHLRPPSWDGPGPQQSPRPNDSSGPAPRPKTGPDIHIDLRLEDGRLVGQCRHGPMPDDIVSFIQHFKALIVTELVKRERTAA